ncbi:MAG: AI-2E family transporter [Candidatus Eremiobacteraeota bacterium]|nr:AI-2E family transporter [Candidatus Eremiobacteraeota bacterium]
MRGTRRNPWRWLTDQRVTYALKILMVLVLAFYVGQFVLEVLARIANVVYILVAAIFLAYIIYPAVHWLHRRMPLVVAIALVYVAIIAAFVLLAVFIVPHVMDDVQLLVQRYPDLVSRLHSIIYNPHDPVTSRLPSWIRDQIASAPTTFATWLKVRGLQAFGQFATLLAGTIAIVAIFVVVPVVTAYLLLDLRHLKQALAAVIPEQRWRDTMELLSEIDQVIGGFIRGQTLVATMIAILVTVALILIRVPYPYLFGLLAGLGDLVPYVGAVAAFFPAFIAAVLSGGWVSGVLVAVAFVVIFEAEGHFIAPNVVGKQVKLSAFVVLVALLIGAELAGLFGMLVAVPVAGVIRVIATRVVEAAKSKPPPS